MRAAAALLKVSRTQRGLMAGLGRASPGKRVTRKGGSSFWGRKLSLCTGAKPNLRDIVLGEVEKNSFIALPGKGDTMGACLRNCVSQPSEDLVRSAMGFPGGSEGKASVCNAEDLGLIPGSGRSPGEGMATHSSILAWRILWTEKPGGLQSTGSRRVGTSLSLSFTFYGNGSRAGLLIRLGCVQVCSPLSWSRVIS